MALSEKLYALRKKSGLSQEQLAEQLKVSRQAISKWESGTSVPESDKLIAISDYFQVSLDYLLKDVQAEGTPLPPVSKTRKVMGMAVCAGGLVGLLLWSLLALLGPDVSQQISHSSAIVIDGNGILLILCIGAVIAGALLLLTASKKK